MTNAPTRRAPEPAPHWDFDDATPEPRRAGPSFTLGGEVFHCVDRLAGGVLPRLMSAMRVDERGRQLYNNPDVLLFMEDVIALERPVMKTVEQPDDVDDLVGPSEVEVWEACDDLVRWQALMFDKARPIDIARIGEVMFRLTTYYTERPTSPSAR